MIKLSQYDNEDKRIQASMLLVAAIHLAKVNQQLRTHQADYPTAIRVVKTIFQDVTAAIENPETLSESSKQLVEGLREYVKTTGFLSTGVSYKSLLASLKNNLSHVITTGDRIDTDPTMLGKAFEIALDEALTQTVTTLQEQTGINLDKIIDTGKVLAGNEVEEEEANSIPKRISPKIKADINDTSDPRDALQSTLAYNPNNPIDAGKPDVIKNYEQEISSLPEVERQKRLERFKFAYFMKSAWLTCKLIKEGRL